MSTGPSYDQYRRAIPIAQHEMGHYVVARILGFRTGYVEVELMPFGHHGRAELKLPSTQKVDEYLSNRVCVLFAGAAAETLLANAPHPVVDQEVAVNILRSPTLGAEQDYAKARELIHVLRNVVHAETDPHDDALSQQQLNDLDARLWTRTVEMVEAHANTIMGLAAGLTQRMPKDESKVRMRSDELDALPAIKALVANGTFKA